VSGIYSWYLGDISGSLAMLVGIVLIGLIFWIVFPRKYQVYEGHLHMVLGGPVSSEESRLMAVITALAT
jgi:lipoprotein signal peptidase